MKHRPFFRSFSFALSLLFLSSWALSAETYRIDPVHSSVAFKIRHLTTKVPGNFTSFSGVIALDEKDMTRSSVEVTIKTASIDTRIKDRDAHLRSPAFFDVKKYPDMTFISKKIVKGEGDAFQIIGDLTMHGVTKPVTLNAEFFGTSVFPMDGSVRAGFSATAKITRKDFGVSWNKALDTGSLILGNDVTISLDIEAVKQAPPKEVQEKAEGK